MTMIAMTMTNLTSIAVNVVGIFSLFVLACALDSRRKHSRAAQEAYAAAPARNLAAERQIQTAIAPPASAISKGIHTRMAARSPAMKVISAGFTSVFTAAAIRIATAAVSRFT